MALRIPAPRNGLAVVLLLWAAAPASSQQLDWTGAVNSTYSTAGNWSPSGPPGSSATARFNLATNYNVTFTANANVDAISVNNGSVTWNLGGFTYNAPNTTNSGIGSSLTIHGGTFNAGGLSVGSTGATSASLTVESASAVTLGAGGFSVGSGGHGSLVVSGLSSFTTANATTFVGANPTGVGTATVVGAGSSWTANGTVRIGSDGTGTVNVLNGGAMTAAAVTVGEGASGVGTLNVSGLNATFTTAGAANIGGSVAGGTAAAGTLDVGGGATVNLNGATTLKTSATLNLTGGTLNLNTLTVETGATVNWTGGTITFANASTITGPVLATFLGGTNTLGSNRTLAATSGTLTLDTPLAVNGGKVTAPNVTVAAPLVIGAFGNVTATDTFTINTGQTVQVSDLGTLGTTNPMFNNGTLQLNGPSAQVTGFAYNLGVVQGTGRFAGGMNNSTLGTIRARAGDYLVIDSGGLTNSGNIELSGGTLEYTHPISNLGTGFISGRGEFRAGTSVPGGNGLSNSGVVAFSGGTTDVRGDVQNNPGGVIVSAGGGVVTFYDDVVHNGTEIRTNAGARTVFFGGQSGAGPFTGTGTVEYNGDLRPGNSPANVTYAGNVILNPSAKLHMELGGTTPGSQHDRLTVSGTITVGGTLDVVPINGFKPQPGQSFILIDNLGNGPIVGTFAGISEGALFTSNGVTYQASYLGGTGNDFVITPVPEPTTVLLVAFAAGGAAWIRRRGCAVSN
jgi:T5SS/PEP-CTERM-associated repeat protein